MKKVDISIGMTFHKEGLLAHKTMLSVFRAINLLRKNSRTYEILIHIDNGDKVTLDYFNRYKKDPKIRIFKNNFSDPGLSRNFLTKKAKGEYISLLDGDDLVSSNWLVESINVLEKSRHEVVVHPEAILTFGVDQSNVLTLQKNSSFDGQDKVILLGENMWCSVLVAKTQTLLNNPYKNLNKGYGHEDYVFNIETINKGIGHQIAKETVLFYRRSDNSRLSTSNRLNNIIPYMEFFSFDKFKNLDNKVKIDIDKSIKAKGYKIYKNIRNNNLLNFFITPVAKVVLKMLEKRKHPGFFNKIPDFIINEWIEINSIETQLYPYGELINNLQFYKPEDKFMIGKSFVEISREIKFIPDYIFIVPWLVRGGADKVIFNTIKALKENNPDWNITIISTEISNNPWAKNLPEYANHIDFAKFSAGLNSEEKDILFARLITQLNCKKIHIINSIFAYRWFMNHKELAKNQYKLTASIFASGYIPESNLRARFSFDDPFILDLYTILDRVFTDNKNIIKESEYKNGFPKGFLKLQYQPVDQSKIREYKKPNNKKFKILWASRVTEVKLPEIVKNIGDRLDPSKFQIDIFGEFSKDINKNIFDETESINYCGSFDDFNDLPVDKYNLYLYTSLTDGMPNTILEATLFGLPILASNDGGVSELIIDQKTGILVNNPLDTDSYVKKIKEVANDQSSLESYVKNAQKILKDRHSWDGFVKEIKKDFNQ